MNAQIDATAGILKLLEDEIEYIPRSYCDPLDEQIQTTLTENADATSAPGAEVVSLIQDLATVQALDGETLEEFGAKLFTEFSDDGPAGEDIGFALPRDSYPATCGNSAAFADLEELVRTTTEAVTYKTWLENKLATACDATQTAFANVEQQLAGSLGFANAIKEGLVADFFTQLGGDDQTIDAYRGELEDAFAAAVAADLIEFPSEFEVAKPDSPELCEPLVEQVSAQIDIDVEAVRAIEDFNAYTEATICGGIADEVDFLLSDSSLV